MPVQVQGPDGNTYQFPDGTDKSAAIAYFKKKGIGVSLAPKSDPSGRTPSGEPAQGDTRNVLQRRLDNLITPDPRREEWQGGTKTGIDAFSRGVAENVIPLVSHPIESAKGLAKTVGHAAANSGQSLEGFIQEMARPVIEGAVTDYMTNGPKKAIPHIVGQGVGMAAIGELQGEALRGAGKVYKGLAPRIGEKLNARYGPRTVEVGGEKIPVAVGEASPESSAGRTQLNLKRSGAGAEKFDKVEKAQQEAVKDVIRNTAQKASGQIGPLQAEPGAVVNDAATASFAQAEPLYSSLDTSLKTVPGTLKNVSKLLETAIGRARKLGAVIAEGSGDISKIAPEKDGAIQWGGSKISKVTHPDRWADLVSKGIIDESGNGTPIKAYRNVISQLKAMQRSSTDGATRYALGREIASMTESMDKALEGTGLEKTWHEADRLWRQGKARIEVSKAITDATKGTPAHLQNPGVSPVPTKLQGASLVDKLNTLSDEGTLEDVFTGPEIRNLRESADILDRIQRTPVGKGAGESMSMSRGLTHAIRGNAGPLIGAGAGFALGGLRGAEAGAGMGFIIQRIGEQALIRVMTKLEGVKALEALESAKSPSDVESALTTMKVIAGLAPRQHPTDAWQGIPPQ